MKYVMRCYRILKPVCIHTSYIFTLLTVFYLAAYSLSGKQIPFSAGLLGGLLAFSVVSAGLWKLFLDSKPFHRIPYALRLVLYLCGVALWACVDLYFLKSLHQAGIGKNVGILVLAIVLLCCVCLELFNRYRTHMYNKLLKNYKNSRKGRQKL